MNGADKPGHEPQGVFFDGVWPKLDTSSGDRKQGNTIVLGRPGSGKTTVVCSLLTAFANGDRPEGPTPGSHGAKDDGGPK